MAAISTNAIAAPASAAAPAKASANDTGNALVAGSPFAAILAATNNQQPAASSSSSGNSDNSDSASAKDDAAPDSGAQANAGASAPAETADASSGPAVSAAQARIQIEAEAANAIQDGAQPIAKPAPKGGKTANDNQAADNQASSNQASGNQASGAAQPMGPSLIAMAQVAQPAVPAQQMSQQAGANDEGGDDKEAGAVSAAGKPGTRPVPAGKAQPDAAAASDSAAAQSPAAVAQAAIKGQGNSGNNGNNGNDSNSGNGSGNNSAGADKQATKTADSISAPQIQPQPQQPQQPQAHAPSMASAIPAAANDMPTPAHNIAVSVQVAPQSAPNLNSLAVEIAARSQGGARQFEIRLDPPELGRVDVRLSIDAAGKTQAHLTADHPETLSLLQKDSSTLTQALRDSGLDVSHSGLNFSLRGQNGQTGNDKDGQGRGARSSLAAARVLDAAQTASSISFTGGASRLDIHV